MPTKHPRVNVVLEEPLYKGLRQLAQRDKVSISLKARDVIKQALEIEEDLALGKFAEEREKSFERKRAKSHAAVWSHLPRRSR